MLPERPYTSMDTQCANFYAKDLSLNAERQRIRCAWALMDMFASGSIQTGRANVNSTAYLLYLGI